MAPSLSGVTTRSQARHASRRSVEQLQVDAFVHGERAAEQDHSTPDAGQIHGNKVDAGPLSHTAGGGCFT